MTPPRKSRLLPLAFVALGVVGAVWVFYAAPHMDDSQQQPPADKTDEAVEVPESALAPDLDTNATWNTYHGDAALTGVAASTLPESLQPLWRFLAGAAVFNTPVVSEGRVFFANEKGKVFATDLHGQELWSRQLTAGTRADGTVREAQVDAPLACFNGRLYVGDADGVLLALDVATGEERWRQDVGAPILGTPNWLPRPPHEEGVIYVIAQDNGELYCLDAVTGEKFWTSEGVSRCDGSPGAGSGVVVFGSCDAALHVFSAATGTLERNIAIEGDSQVASGVAIVGDSAFSGCRSGKVLQVNVKTGETVWVSEVTDFEIFTTPAVTDRWVVLGAEDGLLYALDRASGEQRWTFDTGGTPQSPVIAGDKVVVTADGKLFLLSLVQGRLLWSYEVSDFISAPAVAGSLVIVGSDDGSVAAFYGGPS